MQQSVMVKACDLINRGTLTRVMPVHFFNEWRMHPITGQQASSHRSDTDSQ